MLRLLPIVDVNTRVAAQLNAFNDSMLTERAAAKGAEDWTRTDASGKHWGIAPGTVHLGGVRLRLAKTVGDSIDDVFQPPPGRRDEAQARMQLWNEIQLQARRAEAATVFNDRVKQIRERKNTGRKPGGKPEQ
ncbi:MAG: hypothetical protein ACRERX_20340 [Pseudomonas sp.]